MKKSLPLSISLLALCSPAFAQTSVQNQEVTGVAVTSVSNNGKWMVCEIDAVQSLSIINLETGKKWSYIKTNADGSEDYSAAFTRSVSDDGVVVGEDWNIPSYWTAGADGKGKWTNLKGYVMTEGYVYATVGAITPDGSMIVGSLGKGDGSMTSNEDVQLTYPCVWYRNDDGTYGDPVWLPNTGPDIFGRIPQYVNCIAVSDDGKVIGAMMRSGSGYFHFPIAYILGDNGEWELKYLGMNLINPKNITPNPYPGEFDDDIPMPNYEAYMTPEQLAKFYAEFDPQKYLDQGYTDDDVMVQEHIDALNYMTGANAAEYRDLLEAWLNGYVNWEKNWAAYEKTMLEMMASGYDFEFNNIMISPDGKYIYSTGKPGMQETYIPVCFDVATDAHVLYPNDNNILISSIAADYSILGQAYDKDGDLYRMGYIFPQGDTTPVTIVDYLRENAAPEVYDWMEDHMYQSVVAGITSDGSETFKDTWVVGKPVCTPDMGLIAFASSMLYWEVPIDNANYVTFILNTGLDVTAPGNPDETGVETVEVSSDGRAEYYNLQGVRVANPDRGLYIKVANGKATKIIK